MHEYKQKSVGDMVDNNDDENAEDKGDAGIGKAAEDMRPQKLRSVWLKTMQDGKDTSAPQHPENSITHVDHNAKHCNAEPCCRCEWRDVSMKRICE